jgi:hypothetical protein
VQPIVFISHFRVRAGKLSDYRRIQADVARELEGEKRRTLLFLVYLDQLRERVTAFHVFADAQSMDIHLISSDERSKVGAQFLIPAGWEIYGNASTSTLATVESMAASTGVSLAVHDEFLTGFMRIA